MLYGCELWASSPRVSKWKQIEKIQKCLIISKFKIKSLVSYEIILSATGATSIEAIAMVQLIRYLKRMITLWDPVLVDFSVFHFFAGILLTSFEGHTIASILSIYMHHTVAKRIFGGSWVHVASRRST